MGLKSIRLPGLLLYELRTGNTLVGESELPCPETLERCFGEEKAIGFLSFRSDTPVLIASNWGAMGQDAQMAFMSMTVIVPGPGL